MSKIAGTEHKTAKLEKKPKPIPKVGKRTKERIKENGTESALFDEIWNERDHICETCGKPLKEKKNHNFDHVKPKGMNKDLRYDKSNLRLVCFSCHFEKTTGLKYRGINLD